jgi:hypothetical protein
MLERTALVLARLSICALIALSTGGCAREVPAAPANLPPGALIAPVTHEAGAAESRPAPTRATDLRPGQRVEFSERLLRLLPHPAEGTVRAEVVTMDPRSHELILRVEDGALQCAITATQLPLVIGLREGSLIRADYGGAPVTEAAAEPTGSQLVTPVLERAIALLRTGGSATFELEGGAAGGEPYLRVLSVKDVDGPAR